MRPSVAVATGPCLRFTSPPHSGKGNLPASGPWMPLFNLSLMRRKKAGGAFRWPLPVCHPTDAERVELPSRVLETRVLSLDEASRKRKGDASEG